MAAKPDDDAIKARIIKHLNNDHQDSLVLYLEHYLKLSSFSARNAQVTDVNLSGLTLTASGVTHVVPYPSGPIKSFSEIRPTVVALDQECRKALKRSDITVKTFVPPTGINLVFAIWVAHNIITMWKPENFYLPGTFMYDNVYTYIPWYADLCYKNAWWVFWVIWVGHGIELPTQMLPRLRKHNVPLGSGLWFSWVTSQFVFDGAATIMRFDGLVKRTQAEKEKTSH